MNGLISVIVPVFNGEAFLSDCLKSLSDQTYRKLEILVVDDGSTDGSAALCRKWQEKDGRVRLLQKENGGVSSARNLGIDEARGEYVAFVDSDDWVLPEMLEEQLELLQSRNADMILDDYLEVGKPEREAFRAENGEVKDSERPDERREKRTQEASGCRCIQTDAAGYVNGWLLQSCTRCWSILFRRELIGDVRFPEELSIGEDLLFLSRLSAKLKKVLIRDRKSYCYYQNAEGAMLSGFRPSYLDQITCWELAEKELSSFGLPARERLLLCRFQAALLVAGKLAVADGRTEAVSVCREKYLPRCLTAAKDTWRLLGRGGRRKLSAGYRIKGAMFLHAPMLYLRSYHVWKRKEIGKNTGKSVGGQRKDKEK